MIHEGRICTNKFINRYITRTKPDTGYGIQLAFNTQAVCIINYCCPAYFFDQLSCDGIDRLAHRSAKGHLLARENIIRIMRAPCFFYAFFGIMYGDGGIFHAVTWSPAIFESRGVEYRLESRPWLPFALHHM